MLNGLLCPVRQAPAEQIVDTDLRALFDEHIENLLANTDAREGRHVVASLLLRFRQWRRP
jgi:hypothetical protein